MRINTEAEIRLLRKSGRYLAEILALLIRAAEPGITTGRLNELALAEMKRRRMDPVLLGFHGYPACICVSVNDQLVHGIPGPRILAEGDIVGLDITAGFGGMITDMAVTVGVGQITPEAAQFLTQTQQALEAGIRTVKAGVRVGDVAAVIQRELEGHGLGVVRELTGHGVGRAVHEDPIMPNFGRAGQGPKLPAGLSLAIEPMATLGSPRVVLDDDDWTYSTADGSLSAQFEHTVLVTPDGCEILTLA